MRLLILGKVWLLRHVANLSASRQGECDAPSLPRKEIRIRSRLSGERKLEVLIHEMTHAANWHLDEEFVTAFAKDVSRALWRLGYRNQEEK